MTRVSVLSIVVVVALLLLAEIYHPSVFAAVEPNAYVNSNNHFSINPPAGWSTDTSGSFGTSVIFYGPTDSNFRINMNVIAGSTSQGLSAFVSSTKSQLAQGLNNYRLVSEGAETIGGVDAYELVNNFTQGAYNIKDRQDILVQNQEAYVITSTALQSNYDTYSPAFGESVQTFKVTSTELPLSIIVLFGIIAAAVAVGLAVFFRRRRSKVAIPPPAPISAPGTMP